MEENQNQNIQSGQSSSSGLAGGDHGNKSDLNPSVSDEETSKARASSMENEGEGKKQALLDEHEEEKKAEKKDEIVSKVEEKNDAETELKKNKNSKISFGHDAEVFKKMKKMRRESEEEEASQLARSLGMNYLDLNIFPIDQENIAYISREDAEKYGIAVIYKQDRFVKVAILDPNRQDAKDYLEKLKSEKELKLDLYVVSQSSINRAWEQYDKIKLADVFDFLKVGLTGKDLEEFEVELGALVGFEEKLNSAPTTQVLSIIMAAAIKLNASDIHFEPQTKGRVFLRFRIDGVLQIMAELRAKVYYSAITRIKILGDMMVNEREMSQDGRFSIAQGEGRNDIGVRVSIIPTPHGESIVLRLLNSDIENLKLETVGIEGRNYETIMAEIDKKQGMIINSGPTGSGKTTTLYAIINRLNTPDKKIISIEDPVEYQVEGVSQSQVEVDKGYTFYEGLRAAVRQDPDIMLIGEIRDDITAEAAVHASLTGHLVLSTIHANSAPGVVGRIIDLGVKPTLIAPAVNCFIAQRLLRKLCPHCKEQYVPAKETVDTIKKMLSLISPKAKVEIPKKIEYLYRPKGCVKCRGLGYKGRVGIFEILTINEEIQKLIERLATEYEIRQTALEQGMITLDQDGILKVSQGVTSLEELQRVVGKGDYLMELYEKLMIQALSSGIFIEKKIFDKVDQIKENPEQIKKELSDAAPSQVLRYILATALLMNTGDVHVEPSEEEFKARFRIDGVLHDIIHLPITEYLNFVNEVKNLGGFKTQTHQGVIDGRFRIKIDDEVSQISVKAVDVRLSIIMGGFGDIIVMRLLTGASETSKLSDLKMNSANLEKIKKNMIKPNGIILNTGPTGSGKTTTLYSILAQLNKPQVKIITVEDPIEYQVNGLIQTQVNEEEGYTFAGAMRALLRQNPDIMMIGEIRDEETAKVAFEAALTGHLVLSTLHTNSAAGSLHRLVGMGISLSDIAAGTNCFMAQRLVRVLCPNCKKQIDPSPEEAKKIQDVLDSISPKSGLGEIPHLGKIYEPVGCDECHGLGYKGRTPIAEILEINQELEKIIVKNPTTSELENRAVELGMITMAQDGILRVLEGVTSFDEVARVSKEIDQSTENQFNE